MVAPPAADTHTHLMVAPPAAAGVCLVVTLTEEEPLPAAWFEGTGVANLFVPVPNYCPPTLPDMDKILSEWPSPEP